MTVTVFQARKILTMNPQQPEATHVAVRDGRVLAVGDLERMLSVGRFTLDDRYADQVLMPGLVEGHSHLMAGGLWMFTFVGYHARTSPDGKVWEGCRDFDEVIARLIEVERGMTDPKAALLAWGMAAGALYGATRTTTRWRDVAGGFFYGLRLFAGDTFGMALLGLRPDPKQISTREHVSWLLGHWVFSFTAASSRSMR